MFSYKHAAIYNCKRQSECEYSLAGFVHDGFVIPL